jgi:hypothetical protein
MCTYIPLCKLLTPAMRKLKHAEADCGDMINPGPRRPSTRRSSIAWSTLPLKHPMILPDADSESDSKKGRAGPSHPRDGVVMRAGDDASPPPTATSTPVSAPELPEPEPEPLPPYTPREIDPLLPGPARKRKCTWRRRVLQRGLPLLALAAVLAWAAVHTLHQRTQLIREVPCLFICCHLYSDDVSRSARRPTTGRGSTTQRPTRCSTLKGPPPSRPPSPRSILRPCRLVSSAHWRLSRLRYTIIKTSSSASGRAITISMCSSGLWCAGVSLPTRRSWCHWK